MHGSTPASGQVSVGPWGTWLLLEILLKLPPRSEGPGWCTGLDGAPGPRSYLLEAAWGGSYLQVLVDEVSQQLLQHVGGDSSLLCAPLQMSGGQCVAAIAHGKLRLRLQRKDEGQQEHLVVDELSEELAAFLHTLLLR